MLKSSIHIFTGGWGGGVGGHLLMLSPKMLKSNIHIFTGGWGWGGWWPPFDAESKNAKVQYSHFHRWVGGLVATF